MYNTIQHNRFGFVVRLLSVLIIFTFLSTTILPPGYAQSIGLTLPLPGAMVSISPAFTPVLLKGMTVHPDNPLQFDFILDSGNTHLNDAEMRNESERLVKYFLASMTVPHNDLWVNLSPYEQDRIIPEELGKTELGRDLLAQDYMLKQLTATLVYPENELGQKFWKRIHKIAKEQYGVDSVPTDVFNKVWILPETATVYEHQNTVYIVDTYLKVMLDEDYILLQKSRQADPNGSSIQGASEGTGNTELPALTKQIIREVILPEIEKEVNQGKNFAPLRQIYHSLILAKWYKQTVKNSLMSKVYIDQNKTAGIESNDTQMKERIYGQYMEAYKKGVFDYIKEDYDELSKTVIPRQYFSGGFQDANINIGKTNSAGMVNSSVVGKNLTMKVEIDPQENDTNASILSGPWTLNGARNFLRTHDSIQTDKAIRAINMVGRAEEFNENDVITLKELFAKTYSNNVKDAIKQYLTKKQLVDAIILALQHHSFGHEKLRQPLKMLFLSHLLIPLSSIKSHSF